MPRPLRTVLIGGWYWVCNSAVQDKVLFSSPSNYETFLRICWSAFDVYGVECHAYVLGKKHYYFLLHTPNGNLSKALRQVNGMYTQFYNKKSNQNGPIFKDRFKSVLIQDTYLRHVLLFIYQMPKLSRWTQDILGYAYSSLKAFTSEQNQFVKTTLLSGLFEKKSDMFLSALQHPVSENIKHFFTRKKLKPVLGDDNFTHKFSKKSPLRGKKDFKTKPSIDTIIQSTAQILNEPISHITESKRGRNNKQLGRSVAIYLCRYVGNYTIQEIADTFNVSHYSAISVRLTRFKKYLKQDVALQQKLLLLRRTVGKFRI